MMLLQMISDIFLQTSIIEWLGVSFSVGQVLLSRVNNPKNYYFGIAGVLLTIIVMFQSKLYAEVGLNVYYLIMSIYGLWFWKHKKNNQETPITTANKKEWGIVLIIVGVSFVVLSQLLQRYTNSDVPIWDAAVSASAFAGMWLMAKRKIENWILLNISNFIAVPLLWHKQLYLYAGLTVFLFIVAILGFFNWKKIMQPSKISRNHAN